jgi:predicted RNase H-like HicB family nuclease
MPERNFNITIDLSPVVTKDEETGSYIARFADIPSAIALDETEEKAVLRLISIFEVLLKEQKELIFEKLLKKHIEKAIKEESPYELFRISGMISGKETMKLKMMA